MSRYLDARGRKENHPEGTSTASQNDVRHLQEKEQTQNVGSITKIIVSAHVTKEVLQVKHLTRVTELVTILHCDILERLFFQRSAIIAHGAISIRTGKGTGWLKLI